MRPGDDAVKFASDQAQAIRDADRGPAVGEPPGLFAIPRGEPYAHPEPIPRVRDPRGRRGRSASRYHVSVETPVRASVRTSSGSFW